MKDYSKAILVLVLAVACTAFVLELLHRNHHHSSEVASDKSATFFSCLDLQRELNCRNPKLKLAEDGICGPATMAAWNEVVFNGYALELWPENAK